MKRIQNLLHSLKAGETCIVTNPTDIYYLAGLEVSVGSLVIAHEGSFLLVDGRYFEACKKTSPVFVHLAEEGRLFELIKDTKWLIVDKDNTSHGTFLKLEESAKKYGINLQASESLIKPLRAIKDETEIQLLKEASDLGLEGFDFAASLLKTGITEQEVACELEYFWRKKGAQGVAFDPIIAFGPNSAMPHYRAGQAVLKDGDLVLIDIGVKWKRYHSDMTRVVFHGVPDPKLKEIHGIVKEANQRASELLKPGVLVKEVDGLARQIIANAGYGEYFTHSLGHGVGLDIHEFPLIKSASPMGDVVLQEGMVITIEPGIYLPGIGGVRLEDTVIITKDGYENLTKRDYA
jgi:Xaa-Pro aminopeptidase